MTRIYNPVALEPDENTFVTSLAFNTSDGVLTAGRNDGVNVTTDLDGRYLEHVVDDTSPQLGGNLDLNNHDIDGTGNINTTGTATFSGDLTVGTDALFVDASDNKVGIGTTTPGEALEVVGNVEADNFIGGLRGEVQFQAKAGEALTKGDPVYISSFDVTGNLPVVGIADANDTNKMPAFGLAESTVSLNSSVTVVTFGTLSGLDTSSFSLGDVLYVSDTGTLTNTRPKGESSLIQNIGKVQRVHATSGSIKVGGAGRTNDVPNLNEGNVFIGDATNCAVARALTLDDSSETSTNKHFTASDEIKLDNIESGAQVNVQSDWNSTDTGSDAYIRNKPTLITENTHLDTASFDNTTRDLSLNMTDPTSTITVNIPESGDASTYVDSASFNSSDGVLTLTRTDEVTVTADLDGRYVPYDLTIPTGSYNANSYVNTGIYSIDSNATNLPSDLPSWADELTLQVWEAGAANGVQTLYTANGTTSVQIGRIYWRMWSTAGSTTFSSWRKVAVENEYQPLYLTHNYYTGDLNDLIDSGIYYIHPTSTNNRPTPLLGQGSTVEVIRIFQSSSSAAFGIKQICRENTFSSSSPKIERGRTYEREWNSTGTWSDWVLVTKGGIPGDLKSLYFAANLNSSTYTDTTGMWSLAASYPLSGWPENFPSGSDYNVLETVRTHTSGAGGYQKLYCADYDSATTHVREFKRTIQSGAQGDWFEYCLQGSPIYKEVLAPTVWTSTIGNNPDTEYVSLYVFDGSSTSAAIYGFSGGYAEGQKLRFMRATNSTTKTLTFYHNSYYATQPVYTRDSKTLTLTGYESVDFIYYNNIWFVQGYN
jgi:hypothetical protein